MRDFDKNPYSDDEVRVALFIMGQCGIGGGDDPIGFLLASYAQLIHERINSPRPKADQQ